MTSSLSDFLTFRPRRFHTVTPLGTVLSLYVQQGSANTYSPKPEV